MSRLDRQNAAFKWVNEAFGKAHADSLHVRGLRMLEEAIETAQACGVPADLALKLVARVYDKPVGDLAQEIGGLSLTLLALCASIGISCDLQEERELGRVLTKHYEDPTFFAKRNAAKDAAGFGLPK